MRYAPGSMLLIDASPFGQSLLLLPAVRAIRAAYPKAFIAAAAATGTRELLAFGGLVDEAIDLGVIGSRGKAQLSPLKRLLRLTRDTRRDRFDLALDFAPRLETQAFSRLMLRSRTITPSKFPNLLDAMFGRAGGAKRPGDHASDYQNVLRQIGLEMSDARLNVALPSEENARFEQLLERQGSRGGEPLVVLYAAEGGLPRGWAVESFGELGARLASNFGARAIAVDEPSDKNFTGAVSGLLPKGAIKLASPRALEVAAAVARASLVVTDDFGMARMAVDFGTPVLEVTDWPLAARLAKSHRVICGSSRARVSTDEVFDIACEMLQESRSESLFHR